MIRRTFVFVALLVLSVRLYAQDSVSATIARVNELAAQKQFARAEQLARKAVAGAPRSRDARLALANTLLWQKKYSEARPLYLALLDDNPRDADARLGLANAEYWSGDYRRAARDYRGVLAQQPRNAEASRSLKEISSAARPGFSLGMSYLKDDQPYDATEVFIHLFGFIDPLTKYGIQIGDARYHSGPLSEMTPSIRGDVESAVIPSRLTVRGAATLLRFPDQTSGVLPALSADLTLAGTVLSFTGERRPLFRSAGAIASHPTADAFAVRWSRGDDIVLHAEHLSYFDDNSGDGADAYALVPIGRIRAGASVAWRDTGESRFVNGAYTLYYTPQQHTEARAIVAVPIRLAHSTVDVHLDAGVGHDRVGGTFYPWRANARWSIPLPPTASFTVEMEHSTTAFYSANEIRAGLAGRF